MFYKNFSKYEDVLPVGVLLPELKIDKRHYDRLNISQNSSNVEFLKSLCNKGVVELGLDKLPNRKEYFDRLKREISTFEELNFTDYILLTWDVINFCKENNVVVGLGRGCFLPASLVKMGDGSFKKIEDVSIGDSVISHDGTVQNVLNTFQYDIAEDLIHIELEDGREIKCTRDHEILTKNRGWVRAEELNDIDELVDV